MNYLESKKNDLERHRWMDALRGIAILLVTHVHVVDSIFAKFPNAPEILKDITEPMAPLRMPILVFLSGLLVSGSIAKGSVKYFSGKLENIAYPFFVWTIIMYAIYMARESYLGEPSPIILGEAMTVSPFHHLWFLYYIFIFYIIAYPLNKTAVLITASLCIAGNVAFGEHEYVRFTTLYLFFLLGTAIGGSLNGFSEKIRKTKPLLLMLSLFLALAFFAIHRASSGGQYNAFYSLSALFIAPVLIRLAMSLEDTTFSRLFEFLGKGSLVIYLTHVPFAMTLPVLLKKYYPGNIVFVYPILMLSTMLFCITMLFARKKYATISLLFSPKYWYEILYKLKKMFTPSTLNKIESNKD